MNNTNIIGAFEAKVNFSALLARVHNGERITITKHGQPVAELIPAGNGKDLNKIVGAIRQIKALRHGVRVGPTSIREAIEEGRR